MFLQAYVSWVKLFALINFFLSPISWQNSGFRTYLWSLNFVKLLQTKSILQTSATNSFLSFISNLTVKLTMIIILLPNQLLVENANFSHKKKLFVVKKRFQTNSKASEISIQFFLALSSTRGTFLSFFHGIRIWSVFHCLTYHLECK